ncbi:MAG: hypothetical protein ACRC2R_13755 [Xenococcaceae cyanobacterium]
MKRSRQKLAESNLWQRRFWEQMIAIAPNRSRKERFITNKNWKFDCYSQ